MPLRGCCPLFSVLLTRYSQFLILCIHFLQCWLGPRNGRPSFTALAYDLRGVAGRLLRGADDDDLKCSHPVVRCPGELVTPVGLYVS